MINIKNIITICMAVLFISCSTKINIKSLRPATINDKSIKQITIQKFENDDIGLRETISAKMSQVNFGNNKYFTIITRDNLDNILEEQKLQDSGIVSQTDNFFELKGAKTILDGKILQKDKNIRYFFETRTNYNTCIKYNKKSCSKYATFQIKCRQINYNLNAFLKITKVNNGNILFAKNFNSNNNIKICDQQYIDDTIVFNQLKDKITNDFIRYVAPTYYYIRVALLEDGDTNYSSREKKLLKNSIKLIESNDLQSARTILLKLLKSQPKSYVVYYNLAIVNEALNELNNSLKYITKSKKIMLENDINKVVLKSYLRIKKKIDNYKKAQKQINNTENL